MVVDVITVGLLAFLSIYLRRDTSFFQPNHPTALVTSQLSFFLYLGGFALVLIVISKTRGLYGPLQSLSGFHEQRLTVQSCLLASLILAGALYFTYADKFSRAIVVATLVSSTILLCARRAAWRLYIYHKYTEDIGTRNVLVIGEGPSGLAIRNHLRRIRHLGFTFKGFVSTGEEPVANFSTPSDRWPVDSEILGGIDQLSDLVRKHFVDELFITGQCSRSTVEELISVAAESGIDIRLVPDLYAINSPMESVGQFPTFPLRFRRIPVASLFIKRMLDIVLAAAAIVLSLPIMISIAIAILIDSPGPIFYCAERIGRRGRSFRCWKFRTMVDNADALQSNILHMNERDSILFKVKRDPRITRTGRFLRKYSLDELPQLFNVLLGTMSIVGPRPPILREVNQYKLQHLRRLDVSPGITGLWQVQARQDPSFEQYISLDTFYVDNWSLWLDLTIMIRTFAVVISGTGS